MIAELNETEFYKCKGLLNEQGQLEAKAVIEEKHPGRVFVDDPADPASGIIWLGSDNGVIFIGDASNTAFNADLSDWFKTVSKLEGRKAVEVMGNHPAWNQTFQQVFAGRLTRFTQKVYDLQEEDYHAPNEPDIDQDYKMVKITASLIDSKEEYDNYGFLEEKILTFWPSIETFLNEGVGYCIVNENVIASLCFTGVAAGKVHGADIETIERHQGKKLGQKAAHAFVKDCLENGYTPYWDCMEINHPSAAVAENIGFKNRWDYFWYRLSF